MAAVVEEEEAAVDNWAVAYWEGEVVIQLVAAGAETRALSAA